jgi:hypothetical protein
MQQQSSNQAMQLTASKPDVYAWGVCRRRRMLRAIPEGSRQLILCSLDGQQSHTMSALMSLAWEPLVAYLAVVGLGAW